MQEHVVSPGRPEIWLSPYQQASNVDLCSTIRIVQAPEGVFDTSPKHKNDVQMYSLTRSTMQIVIWEPSSGIFEDVPFFIRIPGNSRVIPGLEAPAIL